MENEKKYVYLAGTIVLAILLTIGGALLLEGLLSYLIENPVTQLIVGTPLALLWGLRSFYLAKIILDQ